MFKVGDWVEVIDTARSVTPFPFPEGSMQRVKGVVGVLIEIEGDKNMWASNRFRLIKAEKEAAPKVSYLDNELWDTPI